MKQQMKRGGRGWLGPAVLILSRLLAAGPAHGDGLVPPSSDPATRERPGPESCRGRCAGPVCHGRPACSRGFGLVDNCATIPWGAIPAPNGPFVRQWECREVAKAQADTFVVYQHEWYLGGKELGPYGLRHISRIAQRLPGVSFSVVVEPSPERDLNEVRRQAIVQELLSAGVTDADRRVVIAYPKAEGLYGDEAERIYNSSIGSAGLGGAGGAGLGRGAGVGVGGLQGLTPFSGFRGGLRGGFGGGVSGF